MIYASTCKPIADRVAALLLILVLSPLLLLLTSMGWIQFGRPFFVQPRAGYKGRVFQIIKFRSMTDTPGLSDEKRITSYGRLIRRLSLDELPQLFNILMGSMSFVGPRPLPAAYMDDMTPVEKARFTVMPGLTGLSQVSGRNLLPWDERLALDASYAASVSLFGDAIIVLRTLPVLLKGTGIAHPGYATMPAFRRSGKEGPQ